MVLAHLMALKIAAHVLLTVELWQDLIHIAIMVSITTVMEIQIAVTVGARQIPYAIFVFLHIQRRKGRGVQTE